MTFGPIDIITLEFPGNRFKADIAGVHRVCYNSVAASFGPAA